MPAFSKFVFGVVAVVIAAQAETLAKKNKDKAVVYAAHTNNFGLVRPLAPTTWTSTATPSSVTVEHLAIVGTTVATVPVATPITTLQRTAANTQPSGQQPSGPLLSNGMMMKAQQGAAAGFVDGTAAPTQQQQPAAAVPMPMMQGGMTSQPPMSAAMMPPSALPTGPLPPPSVADLGGDKELDSDIEASLAQMGIEEGPKDSDGEEFAARVINDTTPMARLFRT
uniref:Uncharacterized protein n=1 Tax=Chromera velia CCMP2878 TaxID=1169474 RepID=A0A0G4GJ77_9ALVE|eukprot:Cvel_22127.t1-p1 / transcript=Cvel_22127.t1 / gene=Cvel_22127 / organism=Chromera_velia_CCMP2878 / gene_product=hypothetical protein / transcript_product=hypothetical protein / location=Cvel_scaffold2145:3108-9347(+) / protein_length=223 / sequence_SO=supercontig / SO=protein_coding / is_pseudo=false